MTIRENLHRLLENIQTLSGKNPYLKLIAVSKTKPVSDILEAIEAGQLIFGENKIQEVRGKKEQLPEHVDIHLIGAIQSNKIKYCPAIFGTIHSVSSEAILSSIEKHYGKAEKKVDVLIQMNLCNENSKSGLTSSESLFHLIEHFQNSETVKLKGLMTIPDPEFSDTQTATVFRKLCKLREECQTKFAIKNTFTELSMGMTSDYPIAIREGATYIRVGSAIFGERDYSNIS